MAQARACRCGYRRRRALCHRLCLGGWVTGSSSERNAIIHAENEVVAALLPICIQHSEQDPMAADKLNELKSAGRFQRGDVLMEAGWATMPGASEPNRAVANACVEHLAAQF